MRNLLKFPVLIASIIYMATISTAQANIYQQTLPAWADTLERFVDSEGRVDFVALSKDTSKLDEFVEAVGQVSPENNPELFTSSQEILAYHINAYNALAMRGVIDRDIPKNFNSLFKRASFFKFRGVTIGQKRTNLYDYENKVIRPLGEPRVHFVLNCMVIDCPRLPNMVLTADTLEEDLQAATVEFFNNQKYIKVDDTEQKAWLSRLMKFYTKDYVPSGDKQALIAYVNQYREQIIPQTYKVKFLDYDWTINQQPMPFVSTSENNDGDRGDS